MITCSSIWRWNVGILLAGMFLVSCSASPRFVRSDGTKTPSGDARTGAEPARAVTVPAAGRALLTIEGVASYYADDFHRKLTSNGETYDMHGITAAHRTFPFGTLVQVTHLESQQKVVVRINDRGPFVEGRMIDLSLGAAKELGLIQKGTARVRLEVLQWGIGN